MVESVRSTSVSRPTSHRARSVRSWIDLECHLSFIDLDDRVRRRTHSKIRKRKHFDGIASISHTETSEEDSWIPKQVDPSRSGWDRLLIGTRNVSVSLSRPNGGGGSHVDGAGRVVRSFRPPMVRIERVDLSESSDVLHYRLLRRMVVLRGSNTTSSDVKADGTSTFLRENLARGKAEFFLQPFEGKWISSFCSK